MSPESRFLTNIRVVWPLRLDNSDICPQNPESWQITELCGHSAQAIEFFSTVHLLYDRNRCNQPQRTQPPDTFSLRELQENYPASRISLRRQLSVCYIHRKSMLPRTKPLKVQTIVVISEAYTGNLRRYQPEEGIQREMFSFERLFQWSCPRPGITKILSSTPHHTLRTPHHPLRTCSEPRARSPL